jgi:RNA polymerase sigma-70 factor (ECF subfamily)
MNLSPRMPVPGVMSPLFRDSAPVETQMREVYDRHAGELYGYALRALGDRGGAQDLVQEVFLRAWQRSYAYRPDRGPVRGWLFGIARRLAVDEARAAGRRAELGHDLDRLAAGRDELARAEDRIALVEALRRLGDHHRTVLVLVVLQGRSLSEAGGALGVPVGTVKSRLFYALKALRVIAEELGIGAAA